VETSAERERKKLVRREPGELAKPAVNRDLPVPPASVIVYAVPAYPAGPVTATVPVGVPPETEESVAVNVSAGSLP
jgi:hypothetical protein